MISSFQTVGSGIFCGEVIPLDTENINMDDIYTVYTQGHCFSAAAAIAERLTGEMVVYFNDMEGTVWHVLAVDKDGFLYDVNGKWSTEEFESNWFDDSEAYYETESFYDFEEMMEFCNQVSSPFRQNLEFAKAILSRTTLLPPPRMV